MQFPVFSRGLLQVTVSIPPPPRPVSLCLCKFGQITRPIFSKSGGIPLQTPRDNNPQHLKLAFRSIVQWTFVGVRCAVSLHAAPLAVFHCSQCVNTVKYTLFSAPKFGSIFAPSRRTISGVCNSVDAVGPSPATVQ